MSAPPRALPAGPARGLTPPTRFQHPGGLALCRHRCGRAGRAAGRPGATLAVFMVPEPLPALLFVAAVLPRRHSATFP
jgi:hypothetical protein